VDLAAIATFFLTGAIDFAAATLDGAAFVVAALTGAALATAFLGAVLRAVAFLTVTAGFFAVAALPAVVFVAAAFAFPVAFTGDFAFVVFFAAILNSLTQFAGCSLKWRESTDRSLPTRHGSAKLSSFRDQELAARNRCSIHALVSCCLCCTGSVNCQIFRKPDVCLKMLQTMLQRSKAVRLEQVIQIVGEIR
jgi:hypothetical protein